MSDSECHGSEAEGGGERPKTESLKRDENRRFSVKIK